MSAPNRADELRREVAEKNQTAILDAALSHLERDSRASLVEIAKAAGVSRPTLYSHFPTREDLVEAAVRRALDETQREIVAADIDRGTATEALDRLIAASWRSLGRRFEIARLAFDVLAGERLREVHQEALHPFRRLVLRGQGAGELRDDQPVDWMVTVLYSLLHVAAAEVIAGRLEEGAAAELIRGSALGAFRR